MRVALCLGSGGARGWAHIGVLEELNARGHDVVAIAGTSAGALVGGLFAAGKLTEFTEWIVGLHQRDILLLLDPVIGGAGIIKAQRVLSRVSDILDGARIEELPIPYTAVATDLTAQREVWFQHGLLVNAIRASIAIPTAITPVMLHGHLLADGGVMNPLPMDALTAAGGSADLSLAVDLNGYPLSIRGRQPVSESADEQPDIAWYERLRRTASSLVGLEPAGAPLAAQPDPEAIALLEPPRELRTLDVLSMSLNTSQALVTRFRTAANPPDVLVSVPVDACGTLEFHRAEELIALGRSRAAAALDEAGL